MLLALQILCFSLLSEKLIREIFLMNLIPPQWKKPLSLSVVLYFFALFFLQHAFLIMLACFLPVALLIFALFFLKKQMEQDILFELFDLPRSLESRMKQGLSFLSACQKSLQDIKSKKTQDHVKKIIESIQLGTPLRHPDPDIQNFVQDLALIHKSPSPMKRLKLLQRKINIEKIFRLKSKRALFQARIQSGILSLFYLGLLVWTLSVSKTRHIYLILISCVLFLIGLFWIFKIGRSMKWSV